MEVVLVKNTQEWYDVQKYMVACGTQWSNGRIELPYSRREEYGEKACINVGQTYLQYSSLEYYVDGNFNILSFEEFMKRVKEKRYGSGTH